jgi:transposase
VLWSSFWSGLVLSALVWLLFGSGWVLWQDQPEPSSFPDVYKRGRDTNPEICDVCDFTERTLRRTLARVKQTGSSELPKARGHGRPRKITPEDVRYLLGLARFKPSFFLREYTNLLSENRFLRVHITTIHRAFEREGINVKVLRKIAIEQDPMKRADFQQRISRYRTDQLVPIDEVSADDRTFARLFGRSEIGTQPEEENKFVRAKRFSACCGMAELSQCGWSKACLLVSFTSITSSMMW